MRERFDRSGTESDILFRSTLDFCVSRIHREMNRFGTGFPGPATVDGVYQVIGNTYWTSSFWTGQLWLAWVASGDDVFRKAAEDHYDSYEVRLKNRIETDTHDLGFLYELSCIAGHRLTDSERAGKLALEAAELLMDRFLPGAGILQAWGSLDDPVHKGRMIIDCLMNLPLLRWASSRSGDGKYAAAAESHLRRTLAYLIRPDGSSFHTFVLNPDDGRPIRGETDQGYSDDSCWARGQAWVLYGLPLAFESLGEPDILETAARAADYFLAHLPEDGICVWDFHPDAVDQERDSSAAAIAVCGLNRLAANLDADDVRAERYRRESRRILTSLCRSYTTVDRPESEGLLLHAVYSRPHRKGIDESCIWGDYFFLEALVAMLGNQAAIWM